LFLFHFCFYWLKSLPNVSKNSFWSKALEAEYILYYPKEFDKGPKIFSRYNSYLKSCKFAPKDMDNRVRPVESCETGAPLAQFNWIKLSTVVLLRQIMWYNFSKDENKILF
jgi:hypothetical protein